MRTGRWLHGHMQCAFPMTNSDWSSSPSVVSMVRCGLFNSIIDAPSPNGIPAFGPSCPANAARTLGGTFFLFIPGAVDAISCA